MDLEGLSIWEAFFVSYLELRSLSNYPHSCHQYPSADQGNHPLTLIGAQCFYFWTQRFHPNKISDQYGYPIIDEVANHGQE